MIGQSSDYFGFRWVLKSRSVYKLDHRSDFVAPRVENEVFALKRFRVFHVPEVTNFHLCRYVSFGQQTRNDFLSLPILFIAFLRREIKLRKA